MRINGVRPDTFLECRVGLFTGPGLALPHTNYQIDVPVRRVSLEHSLPGVARRLVTFSCLAKKR